MTLVATEYFQSWFAGDGDRMRAGLHPAWGSARQSSREGTEFEPVQEVTVLYVNALYYVLV